MLYIIIFLLVVIVILILTIVFLLSGKKTNTNLDNFLGNDDVTEEEIRSMVREGHEQGTILSSEAEMIHNIFEFDDKEVKDIMTHRKNIVGLDGNMSFIDAIDFMIESGKSRFPVYEYDVDNIIRVGSAGAFKDDINLKDIVIAQAACTDSNYMSQFKLPGTFAPVGDYNLISTAAGKAEELGLNVRVGNILSTDSFYTYDPSDNDAWKRMGVLCVDMEAAALYANAAALSKKALCMLTISDHLYKSEKLDAGERQEGFNDMIKLANSAEKIIVYGNRYRSTYEEIDIALTKAEELFKRGKYKESLELSKRSLSFVDKNIE